MMVTWFGCKGPRGSESEEGPDLSREGLGHCEWSLGKESLLCGVAGGRGNAPSFNTAQTKADRRIIIPAILPICAWR